VSRARKAQGRRALLQIALGLPSELAHLERSAPRAVEQSIVLLQSQRLEPSQPLSSADGAEPM